MNDLISRQAAIDLLCRALHYNYSEDYAVTQALELPSAEPQIVRCKECKYANEHYICDIVYWWNQPNDFCSKGERKENA